jgi:hypothetical protein
MNSFITNSVLGTSRVIVLPDTQWMTQLSPVILEQLFSHVISRKPDLVLHTGDMVNNNLDAEWTTLTNQLARLTAAGIPWIPTMGNHDYTQDGTRSTLVNAYITPPAWINGLKEPGHVENSYTIVTLSGRQWLVLDLEYSPRTATVAWANSIASAYPNLPIILVTHAYLYSDGTRYDWAAKSTSQLWNPHGGILYTPAEGIYDGQELWNALVEQHSNIKIVMCGHVIFSEARRTDTRLDGTICHQIVLDYQEVPLNGAGFCREYYFDEANQKIFCRTWSSYQNCFRTNSDASFYIQMP